MVQNVFFRPVALAASIVSFIVSLLWGVLSLLSTLCYYDIIKYNKKIVAKGSKYFTQILYELYFSGNESIQDDPRIIRQNTLFIISWIYLILYIFWCCSSGVQIVLIARDDKPKKLNISTTIWLLLCYFVCTTDLIVCILFSVDFDRVMNRKYFFDTPETEVLLSTILTLLLLAAKGFILWLVNFIFAVIISVLIKSLHQEINESQEDLDLLVDNSTRSNIYNEPVYNAYENTNSSEFKTHRPWLANILSERFKFTNGWFDKNKQDSSNSVTTLPRIKNIIKRDPHISESENKYNSYRSARNEELSEDIYNEVYSPENENTSVPNPDYSPHFQRRFELDNNRPTSFLHTRANRF